MKIIKIKKNKKKIKINKMAKAAARKLETCPQTIVNPKTGQRCIIVGGRTYKKLEAEGYINKKAVEREVVADVRLASPRKSPKKVKKSPKKAASPRKSPKKVKKSPKKAASPKKSPKKVKKSPKKAASPVKKAKRVVKK